MILDYRTFYRAAPAPIAVLDEGLRYVEVSDAYCEALSMPRERMIGFHVFDVFPDARGQKERLVACWTAALRGETSTVEELNYPIPDWEDPDEGWQDRWWSMTSTPVASEPRLAAFRFDDVTQKLKLERARQAVTHELEHRSNNLLSLVAIIARRSARGETDVGTLVEKFLSRLDALSVASKSMVVGQRTGASMDHIVRQSLSAFVAHDEARVAVDGPVVLVDGKAAQVMAMAVHELSTNAAKYGALSPVSGRVSVRWTIDDDGIFSFRWTETGVGPIAFPDRRGFGTTILEQLLPGQFGGTAALCFGDDGLTYTMTVSTAVARSNGTAILRSDGVVAVEDPVDPDLSDARDHAAAHVEIPGISTSGPPETM